MKAGDIILSLVIIGVFSGLVVFNIVSVEVKKIQENWPEYRCSPMVMPLASQLGPPGTDTGGELLVLHTEHAIRSNELLPPASGNDNLPTRGRAEEHPQRTERGVAVLQLL